MTKEIQIFNFGKNEVRIIEDENGNPWFVAKDVAGILGYAIPHKAVQEHCKHVKLFKRSELESLDCGPRGMLLIPESDVYRLVMRSKLPTAVAFEEWVMEVVLPQLRRTGSFAQHPQPPMIDAAALADALLHKMAVRYFELEERVNREIRRLDKRINRARLDQCSLFEPQPPALAPVQPKSNLRHVQDSNGKLWFSAYDLVTMIGMAWNRAATLRHVPQNMRCILPLPWVKNRKGGNVLSAEGVQYFLTHSRKREAQTVLNWFKNEFLLAVA